MNLWLIIMGAITFDQPSKGAVTSTTVALNIVNKGTGGALNCISDNVSGNGIRGESKGSGTGVYAVSVDGIGVYGTSTNGTAMSGLAKVGTGTGVRGESQGSGVGVYGTSATGTALSGVALVKTGYGLRAENKVDGTGIFGISASGTGVSGLSNTGNGIGVRAESKGFGKGVYAKSATGTAIYAEANNSALNSPDATIIAINTNNNPSDPGIAIKAESLGSGKGLYAKSANGNAIHAESNGGDAIYAETKTFLNAVWGQATNGVGVTGNDAGNGTGVRGLSKEGTGVYAECMATGSGSSNSVGVFAKSTFTGIKVETSGNNSRGAEINSEGMGVLSLASHGQAIYGQSQETHDAVYGIQTASGIGVHGRSFQGIGVHAESDGSGYGIYAKSGTGRYAGYFEGNIRVTGQINPAGGDLAEEFNAYTNIEPGSVMVINNEGNLEPCCISYDKRVAGIVSGAEGYKPGIVLDTQEDEHEKHQCENEAKKPRLAVALTGKVYCKVDASHLPIEIGDMLTTSSTKGHAMKVDEPTKAFGSVIGKALQPLRDGMGMIPVLVGLF